MATPDQPPPSLGRQTPEEVDAQLQRLRVTMGFIPSASQPTFPNIGCSNACGFEPSGVGLRCSAGDACGRYLHPGDPHHAEVAAYYATVTASLPAQAPDEVEQALALLGRYAHSVAKIDVALPALRVVAKRAQTDWERIDYATLPPSIAAYLRTFPPSLLLSIVDMYAAMLAAGKTLAAGGAE